MHYFAKIKMFNERSFLLNRDIFLKTENLKKGYFIKNFILLHF